MEVDPDKQPGEGEVLIVTGAAAFCVKGTMHDVAQKLTGEDWQHFELAETGAPVIVRSSQVVAIRGGTKQRRGAIGFAPQPSK